MTPSYVEGALSTHVDAHPNRGALAYLETRGSCCHGDLGQALIAAATGTCGDWIAYSPSFASFRYVALITNRRVFAFAHDMAFVCARIGDACVAIALESGAKAASDVGPEWVGFQLFRPDHPEPDLRFWLLRAYAAARDATVRTNELRPCDQCREPTAGCCSMPGCTDAVCGNPACVHYHLDDTHDGRMLGDEDW